MFYLLSFIGADRIFRLKLFVLGVHDGDLPPENQCQFELEFSNHLGWMRGDAMRASRSSGARKAFVLKQAEDGVSGAEVCGMAGSSQGTIFNWMKK